jgi:hypothetical protein
VHHSSLTGHSAVSRYHRTETPFIRGGTIVVQSYIVHVTTAAGTYAKEYKMSLTLFRATRTKLMLETS